MEEYIKNLKEGKTDFLRKLTKLEITELIKLIRKDNDKNKIINEIMFLKESYPSFIFRIIYDIEEYKLEASELLKKCFPRKVLPKEYLNNMIESSSVALTYLNSKLEIILEYYDEDNELIFDYLFENLDKSLNSLKKISLSSNLHIRYLFMNYLVRKQYNRINIFYNDITLYLTSTTYQEFEQITFLPKLMNINDISNLANSIFETKDINLYKKIKKFIIDNYKYNNLASHLINPKQLSEEYFFIFEENVLGLKEFNSDADLYFETANKNRLEIMNKYSVSISKNLLEQYKKQLELFKRNGVIDENYIKLDIYGLTRILDEFVTKYLDLSKNKTCSFIAEGTTLSCFRVGDFILKLINTKWSFEDKICPDLYLILPALEEILLRRDNGIVYAGIEVQKYLSNTSSNVPKEVFNLFIQELNKLGYYITDVLVHDKFLDNTRLLDNYKDANGENVPDWFKKYPIVLIDRDRIYKNENKNPKQQKIINF